MKNIDIESIKNKTNNKIGYYNFKEESIKKSQIRKGICTALSIVLILTISTFTVNAATNNGIVNLINKIIKVNNKDTVAEIYEVPSQEVYSKCEGKYVTTDSEKCIKYSPIKDYDGNESTICYPLDTEFDNIEIFYDENNHFSGFHITGTSNGEYFDDYLNDSN